MTEKLKTGESCRLTPSGRRMPPPVSKHTVSGGCGREKGHKGLCDCGYSFRPVKATSEKRLGV